MKKSHVVVYSALLLLLGSVCSQAQQSLTSTRNGDSNAGSQAVSNVSGTGTQRTLPQCSGQPGRLPRGVAGPCKPVLPGPQQLSNELPRHDDGATYVSFDVSGALYLYPYSINDAGAITGTYIDAAFKEHGFLRDPHGNIVNIDVPGAVSTFASAINDAGTVTGSWCPDTTYTHCPGFLRDVRGNITSFDAPGDYYGTAPNAISPDRSVTGNYLDVNNLNHGFVRSRDGSITEFDPPGSSYTWPSAIGADGTIAGAYTDASYNYHGFLRSRYGNISTFDVPGGMNTGTGGFYAFTTISSNPEGAVAGSYFQPIPGNPSGGNYQGFLRHPDGSFDTFYAADYPPCCIWTFPTGITPDATIAGYENDGYGVNHGFVRTRDGNITLFDAPGAATGYFQRTVPFSINAGRVITGFYVDSTGAWHAFVRIPH